MSKFEEGNRKFNQPQFESEAIYTRFTASGTDINQAFNALVERFDEELVNRDDDSFLVFDKVLNVIDRIGIHQTASAAVDQLEVIERPYHPANPSDVIEYFVHLRTKPPIKINDLGSIDTELISQLRLTKDGYIDQLQELLTWLDSSVREISVIDLPEIVARKREDDIQHMEKALVLETLERHGISLPIIDETDSKAWHDFRYVVQQIADPSLRDTSYRLREDRLKGGRISLRNAIEFIEDMRKIRRRALEIAFDNRDASAHEIKLLMEGELPDHTKKLVYDYLQDIAASEGEGVDTDKVGELLQDES